MNCARPGGKPGARGTGRVTPVTGTPGLPWAPAHRYRDNRMQPDTGDGGTGGSRPGTGTGTGAQVGLPVHHNNVDTAHPVRPTGTAGPTGTRLTGSRHPRRRRHRRTPMPVARGPREGVTDDTQEILREMLAQTVARLHGTSRDPDSGTPTRCDKHHIGNLAADA